MNNKGFSLIEVLVTVGLVAVIAGIAVPQYNKYKENTYRVAMKSDLANASKTYNAYSAVNGTFCTDWSQVGLAKDAGSGKYTTSFDKSQIYKKKGFIGFAASATDCSLASGPPIHFKSLGGDTSATLEAPCLESGGIFTVGAAPNGTCAKNTANEFGTLPAACTVGINHFKMGATTEISNIGGGANNIWQVDEEGIITETGTNDCN